MAGRGAVCGAGLYGLSLRGGVVPAPRKGRLRAFPGFGGAAAPPLLKGSHDEMKRPNVVFVFSSILTFYSTLSFDIWISFDICLPAGRQGF